MYREAPEGWQQFGTHLDGVPEGYVLEFSEVLDDDLLPQWERAIPANYYDGVDFNC